jgi:tetratricopeptide (TPR) repeat protein
MTSRNSLPALLAGIFSLAALVLLATPPRKPPRGPHQEPLLPRQEVLRLAGRGYIEVIADYFWIQLVQATGRARGAEEYRDIYPYADLITDLDPRFGMVYPFAGSALPTNLGRETWVNTEESTQLLRKGLKLFPGDLKMNILLAYNLSAFHKQYREAAELLERASKLPGAPSYLPALATRLYAQSGSVDAGLALARSLADSAEDQETREIFLQRVRDLEMEGELRRVDAAISDFRGAFGVAPPDIDTLLWLGFLKQPPHDPKGGGFYIGHDERAYSETQQRRLEVYTPDNRGYHWATPVKK